MRLAKSSAVILLLCLLCSTAARVTVAQDRDEASGAISDAETAVSQARDAGIDSTTLSQATLALQWARSNFTAGNYPSAFTLANGAREIALRGIEVKRQQDAYQLLLMGGTTALVLAAAMAGLFLLRRRRVKATGTRSG